MKRLLGTVLAFTVTALIAGFFCRYDVDFHHDGIFLKPARDMLHGQLLFKDTFSIYGPLTSVLHAGVMKLFGESLLALKLATALTYGFIGAFVFLLSSFMLPWLASFLVVLVWIASAPYYEPGITFFIWPSVYALLFQLASVYFLFLWIRRPRTIWLVGAGVTAAVVFWFRQPVGLLLYGTICLFFVLHRKKINRATRFFHISFLIAHLAAVFILAGYGILSEWFFQSVVFVSWWHSAVLGGRIFPIVFLEKMLPLSYSPVSIWALLPAAGIFAVFRKRADSFVLLLALVGLGSWLQYYPMNDIHHAYWAATPFFPLLVWAILSEGARRRSIVAAVAIVCILFVPDAFNRLRMIKHKLQAPYVRITEPSILRGMLVSGKTFGRIRTSYAAIRKFESSHPQGIVATDGHDVLPVTFARNTKNCHPFTSNWGWGVYNAQFNIQFTRALIQCTRLHTVLMLK